MANPVAQLTRRTVILAKSEGTETTASGSPSTTVIDVGATLVADAEIGNFAIIGDAATLDASAQIETAIIKDNTTGQITLNAALGFTPASGDYVKIGRYGTDPTPAVGTNDILAMEPSITINGEVLERNGVRFQQAPLPSSIGNKSVELSFSVELKGAGKTGSVANVPEIDPLLRACGFKRTLATNDRVYTPDSSSYDSCTIWMYMDQMVYKINGCVGNVNFKLEQGQYGVAEFTFSGQYADLIDGQPATNTAYDTEMPPILNSAALTLDSDTSVSASTFELDMANEVVEMKNMSNSSGPERFFIAGRKPTGSFNPQQILTGDYNFHNKWSQSTAIATFKCTLGDTAGNKLEFDLGDETRFGSLAPADDGGIRRFDIGFNCAAGVNEDNDVKLSFKGD